MKTDIEIEFCIQLEIMCSSEMYCHYTGKSCTVLFSVFLAWGGPGGRAYNGW